MTTAPGANRDSCTSSQCPLGPDGCRSTSLPPIVLIATSIRPSLATSAAASAASVQTHALGRDHALGVAEGSPRRRPAPGRARFRVGGEARDRDRAGGEQQVGRAGVGEVDPRCAPAREGGPERRVEARPHVCERAGRGLHVGGGRLVARVGHEEAEAPAGVTLVATPIPAYGSATPAAAARSSKRKPSPAGSALAPPGHGTLT